MSKIGGYILRGQTM